MGRTTFQALTAIVLGAVLACAVVTAQSQPITAWTNGRWFDGTRFVRRDVYSKGDRLTLRRPARVERTVDLAGGYVAGAFGEAHTHQVTSGDAAASIRTYLQQGIFYVMSQANTPDARQRLGDRVNVPTSVDVAIAGGDFTAPGGHPTALVKRNIRQGSMTPEDLNGGFLNSVSTVEDIDRAWPSVIARRPDFIKILLVYSEDRVAGIPRPTDSDRHGLDPALVPHIVQLAHNAGLRVSAHVESAYDFEVATKAGVDVYAHLPGFWPDPARIAAKGFGIYRIPDELAALAGQHKAGAITTIYETLKTVAEQKEYMQFREPMLDLLRHNLDVLARHQVTIAIGSDQFRTTSVAEALEIHQAGLMAPPALLRALTFDAAATIFPQRAPFGLVEGAPADFLVLDDDPLADFTAVQRIRLRVKAGRELTLE